MAKLLLVEDDNNLREIYQARLTAEGYDIVTAADGEAALSIAKTEKPDLIISDVMMPRISGFEMLDILRNTDELKHVKVIMLTALGQAEDRGRADNLGADKYLVKSQVTLEDIVSAARELLEGGSTEAVAPSEAAPAGVSLPTPEATTVAAPEPVAVPEPEVAAAPEPAAAPAVEPVVPVTPAAETESEPVVEAPVAEAATDVEPAIPSPAPVADDGAVATPVATAVPVSDPDPLTAAPVDDATVTTDSTDSEPEPEVAAAPEPAAAPAVEPVVPVTPAAETEVAEPTAAAEAPSVAVAESADGVVPAAAQDLESEEATVQAQIDSFANAEVPSSVSDVPAATPTTEVPEPPTLEAPADAATPAAANDALLQQAVEDLTTAEPELVASPAEAAAATEAQAEETAVAPEVTETPPEPAVDTTGSAPETDNVTVTGKKVIKPLSDLTKGPDLDALLAKEEAKAADTPVEPTPIVDGETKPPEPQQTFDPNKIAL